MAMDRIENPVDPLKHGRITAFERRKTNENWSKSVKSKTEQLSLNPAAIAAVETATKAALSARGKKAQTDRLASRKAKAPAHDELRALVLERLKVIGKSARAASADAGLSHDFFGRVLRGQGSPMVSGSVYTVTQWLADTAPAKAKRSPDPIATPDTHALTLALNKANDDLAKTIRIVRELEQRIEGMSAPQAQAPSGAENQYRRRVRELEARVATLESKLSTPAAPEPEAVTVAIRPWWKFWAVQHGQR